MHWWLIEEQASRLLEVDLLPMAAVLASAGAEEHCRMLAGWHARTAQRRFALTAYLAATLVLAAGGSLVLGTLRRWTGTPLN